VFVLCILFGCYVFVLCNVCYVLVLFIVLCTYLHYALCVFATTTHSIAEPKTVT